MSIEFHFTHMFVKFFSSVDVSEEAKKLVGTGNRHLVMGDVVSAVSVFQEACAMLWVVKEYYNAFVLSKDVVSAIQYTI